MELKRSSFYASRRVPTVQWEAKPGSGIEDCAAEAYQHLITQSGKLAIEFTFNGLIVRLETQ